VLAIPRLPLQLIAFSIHLVNKSVGHRLQTVDSTCFLVEQGGTLGIAAGIGAAGGNKVVDSRSIRAAGLRPQIKHGGESETGNDESLAPAAKKGAKARAGSGNQP
jgi:hypothetical protein